jgi:hypothetical protein
MCYLIICVCDKISGDPDLYVSTQFTHPSPVNSSWHSFRYGSDMLVINPKNGETSSPVDSFHCV